MEFSVSLFIQEMSGCTPSKVSTISLYKYELNKVDNNGHANMNRRKLNEASALHKNYRQFRKAGSGEVVLSREYHTNLLSSAKWSTPKAYTQLTLYGLSRLCMYTYMYRQTHICNNN